jgi:hypothetical protein
VHFSARRWHGFFYTVAGKAIGFALEQPLHVVAIAYSASGILNSLSIMDNADSFYSPLINILLVLRVSPATAGRNVL